MKSTVESSRSNRAGTLALAAFSVSCMPLLAGPPPGGAEIPRERGYETSRDLPGDFHKYYGQRINYYKDAERRIAKLDLDADLNYDGTIDNSDPADNGAFQQTPPGLVVGVGEMSKFVLRLNPYRVDFKGEAVVTLEVAGINRGDKSGSFDSLESELSSSGQVRIWRDASKTELLIDSRDPSKRFHEWVVDDGKYPANIPGFVPRTFYVEGVKRSGAYMGDVRVLVTVSHRADGGAREGFLASRKKLFKRFRTSFDHILVTVAGAPHPKEYINANVEKVWISGGAGGGAPARSSK
jgi:hypothetical protein